MNRQLLIYRHLAVRFATGVVFLFGSVLAAQAQAGTSTALFSSAPTVTYGMPETLSVAITATAGGAAVAAGTVTFTDTSTATVLAANLSLDVTGHAATSAILGAGSHNIKADYIPDAGHTGSSNTTLLTVIKAVLTVTANNATMTAGSNAPILTAAITGFVNGEFRGPASVLTGDPSLSTTATAASDPGTYPIVVGLGTLSSANYSFVFVNGTVTVQAFVSLSATVAITAGATQSTTVNTVFAVPLQVTVTDQFGQPIFGAPVTFAAPSVGASVSVVSPNVMADINGFASLMVTANTIAGSYSVTATSGSAPAVTFNLTNNAGAPATMTATAGTPQNAQIGTLFTTQLTVNVQDAYSNVVPGATITFAFVTPSNAGGTFPNGNTVVTDISGNASISVRANSSPGSYTVIAASGAATTATFNLANTLPPPLGVPALMSGAANELGIAWSNPLSDSITLTMTALGYDGQLITGSGIQNPAVVTVLAHGQVAKEAIEIFGSGIAGRAGWVEVAPSVPGAGGGFFLLFDSGLLTVDGGALIANPAARLFFPQADNTTIFHVVNTGSQVVGPAALLVYANDGTLLGNTTLSLAAQGGWTGRITDVLPALASVNGYAVIDTQGTPFATPSSTLMGMASYQKGGDIAIEAALDNSVRVQNGYAVHIVSGGGYTSRLKLVNPDSVQQQLQLTFNGATVQRTIPASGRLDESLDQMFSLSGGSLTTGYLSFQVLGTTSGVNGFVEIAGSAGVLTTEPVSGQPQTDLLFSQVAQGSGYYTGLALLNAGLTSSTVTIEVDSPTGAIVASESVTIGSQQRLVGLISELFPAIQNQLGGTVHVTATQGIYGLQVFGTAGSGGGNFLANIPPGN